MEGRGARPPSAPPGHAPDLSLYEDNRMIEELQRNPYVDDWLSGADTEEEAVPMFTDAQWAMQNVGMTLAKWNSNCPLVCDKVGNGLSESEHTKVLGIMWLPGDDCFCFGGVDVPDGLVFTKRVVLRFVARLYDPLGFVTPYAMLAKCLFQELWVLGLDWDVELPPELSVRFSQWVHGLKVLRQLRIPKRTSTALERLSASQTFICTCSEMPRRRGMGQWYTWGSILLTVHLPPT